MQPPSNGPAPNPRHGAIGIIYHARRILLVQRGPDRPLPGYWEFPGGKIEAGETPEAALRRELNEEVGLNVGACTALPVLGHDYAHLRVRLHPFIAVAHTPAVRLHGPVAYRWVRPVELAGAGILPGSVALARPLLLRGSEARFTPAGARPGRRSARTRRSNVPGSSAPVPACRVSCSRCAGHPC